MNATTPLRPSPEEAREWLRRELDDPAYDIAEPTPFDRAARAVGDFLGGLFSPHVPDGWGPAAAVVALVFVTLLVVAALLIWGRPRPVAKSRAASAELFGDDEGRSADLLRRDAEAAAAAQDWDAAVVLRFRAIARLLSERVIVDPAPGATAQAFAREAARAFPASAARLRAAAGVFDDVRYLRRPATGATYRTVAALDDELAAARPAVAGSMV